MIRERQALVAVALLCVAAAMPLRADDPPVLHITAPLAETVARPEIRVTVTCTDDGPSGCVSLVVKDDATDEIYASGTSSIDQDVTLPGSSITLAFTGKDSAGQGITRKVHVYSEWGNRLDEFRTVGGRIVDVDADRILFLAQDQKSLYIRDIVAGTDVHIPAIAGKVPLATEAFLTARGALFVAWDGASVITAQVYEWQDGVLLAPMGMPDSIESPRAASPYAIWNGGLGSNSEVFLRNTLTGTTTTIPGPTMNWYNDVLADGTVAYGTRVPYDIHLYKDGVDTPVTSSTGSHWYTFPRTDGTNTVYRRSLPCCAVPDPQREWTILRHDGNSETVLAGPESVETYPDRDYQVKNGWIAVTRRPPGLSALRRVWRIPPPGEGEEQELYGSEIDVLADDGELTFFRAGRQLATLASTSRISSQEGRAYRIGGQWYVSIGRTLFTVNDDVTATTTALEQSSTTSLDDPVTFTATVTPSDAVGLVSFMEGQLDLATITLSGGTATFTTSTLPAGSHTITAHYLGDFAFSSSESAPVTHEVPEATPFGVPTGLSATATSPSQVVVSWVRVHHAAGYEVARSVNNGPFASIGTASDPPFTDNSVAANTTYLYKVRALAESGPPSGYSGLDPATTVVFTNDPLAAGVQLVLRAHVTQLRTAVNAMRASAGLAPAAFTDPALPAGTNIKAVHVQQLRTALDQARSALMLPALPRVDPVLTAGVTKVKAAHFQELREGCR